MRKGHKGSGGLVGTGVSQEDEKSVGKLDRKMEEKGERERDKHEAGFQGVLAAVLRIDCGGLEKAFW